MNIQPILTDDKSMTLILVYTKRFIIGMKDNSKDEVLQLAAKLSVSRCYQLS